MNTLEQTYRRRVRILGVLIVIWSGLCLALAYSLYVLHLP